VYEILFIVVVPLIIIILLNMTRLNENYLHYYFHILEWHFWKEILFYSYFFLVF